MPKQEKKLRRCSGWVWRSHWLILLCPTFLCSGCSLHFRFPEPTLPAVPNHTSHSLCILSLPQPTTVSLGAGFGTYSFSHCAWHSVGNCWIHSTPPAKVSSFLRVTFLNNACLYCSSWSMALMYFFILLLPWLECKLLETRVTLKSSLS